MLKNSDGRKSATITFALISFVYCLCAITIGLIEELTIAGNTYKFRMIDSGLVLALLGPSFSLYGYRRYIEGKFGINQQHEDEELEDLHK